MNPTFTFFDPARITQITRAHLPHWEQAGAAYFITWRTADSIPAPLWKSWKSERDDWLREAGIDPAKRDWRRAYEELGGDLRRAFARRFTHLLEGLLDECQGQCPLGDATNARIVADSLRHFQGDRYQLGEFVVMPNHVHVIVGGMPRGRMLEQVEGWKHWTAREINLRLGGKGRFWQAESFDHLIRDGEAFERYRRYIRLNPVKARLAEGTYLLGS